MHVVEVRHDGDALAGPMAAMRDWLDAHRIEPSLFNMSIGSKSVVFRLEFHTAGEAAAFARAFDAERMDRALPDDAGEAANAC